MIMIKKWNQIKRIPQMWVFKWRRKLCAKPKLLPQTAQIDPPPNAIVSHDEAVGCAGGREERWAKRSGFGSTTGLPAERSKLLLISSACLSFPRIEAISSSLRYSPSPTSLGDGGEVEAQALRWRFRLTWCTRSMWRSRFDLVEKDLEQRVHAKGLWAKKRAKQRKRELFCVNSFYFTQLTRVCKDVALERTVPRKLLVTPSYWTRDQLWRVFIGVLLASQCNSRWLCWRR